MTLVVTHANGFLGCFTQDDDGSMRQRALIDTGEEPPTAKELAELGNVLADQWGWMPQAVAPAPGRTKALPTEGDSVKALKDAEKARKAKRGYNASDPPTGERCRMIVEYVRHHPDSTIREIVEGLGFEPSHDRLSRWHHQFALLLKARTIAYGIRQIGSTKAKAFRLVEATPEPFPVADPS